MGLESLKRPTYLASQFLGIGFFAAHSRQALQFDLSFFQASFAPGRVALPTMLSAGNNVAFVFESQLDQLGAIPQLRLDVMRQLSDEFTQRRGGKSSDKIQMLLAHGFQIECTAHAVIKDKDCLLMPKRRFRLASSPRKVVVSARLPRSTSRWMGIPWGLVATANKIWGRSSR